MNVDRTENTLRILERKVQKTYARWCRALGWSRQDCLDWASEVSGEGLALAYSTQEQWDSEKGPFLYWAYLKTCLLAHRELERADRTRLEEVDIVLVREVPQGEYRDSLAEYLLKDELKGLLEVLTPDQKLAFALYYVGDLEVIEIARVLECHPKTVYTLLDRGRKRAREVYRKLRESNAAKPRERPHRPQKRNKEKVDSEEEPPPSIGSRKKKQPPGDRPSRSG